MQLSIPKTIESIINLTPQEEIEEQIRLHFPNRWATKKLHSFLMKHRYVFTDLIRVMHRYRKNDSIKWWHIDDNNIPKIQQIFLFRGREEDLWEEIASFIELITTNSDFIEFTSKQDSIFDIGSYDFSLWMRNHDNQFDIKKAKKNIRKLIITGMIGNIQWCTEANLEHHFWLMKDKIFKYINEIYWVYLSDIEWVTTLEQLTCELAKLFETGKGNNRKRAWRMVQAFHWWDIVDIEYRYSKTKERLSDVAEKLNKNGININMNELSHSTNVQWVEIWSAPWEFKGKIIIVSWRAKTPKSMIKKLSWTEEYVRTTSIRDELWISFTYDDNTPSEDIVEIMKLWSNMLADHGYILKNKWEINDDKIFQELMENSPKKPLFSNQEPWWNPNMQNASQSGFMSIWRGRKKEAIGCEIQYSKKWWMDWKKKEDIIYKLKEAIKAWMRWAEQASPKEIFDEFTREIHRNELINICNPDTGKSLWISSYNELMKYFIEKNFIIPHFWVYNEKTILLFTTGTYMLTFERKWNMRPLIKSINKEEYDKMIAVIDWLTETH